MKKLLLSALAVSISFGAMAQVSNSQVQSRLDQTTSGKALIAKRPTDAIMAPLAIPASSVSSNRISGVEVPIGSTVYDLQSNYGTVGNRVKLWDDNTISAVWTKGDASPGFSDRGTGYNYNDGTNWGPLPTARLESIRTGWPNVSGTANSAEIIVNHTPTTMVSRPVKGTGPWTETSPLDSVAVTWPRMVVGGANGNSVHIIGNENTGAFYMTYSRSLDGGATFVDKNILLPNFTTLHFEGSVDGYDIDSRGDVVAIVMGGWNESLTLWKSLDNGGTWTSTTINEFPLAPWDYVNNLGDVDGDGVADTIMTTGSDISVVIDNNNMVHVAVGAMRILGTTPASSYSYFPGTDGLLYWNENMPAGDITNNVIAFIEDIDGSGVIEIPGGLALYQCSLTGMPTLGVDAANNIHLAYSSIIENTTNGNADPLLEEAYRNIYYMYSIDGGTTWSTPSREVPSDFDEQAWPNMAKRVNSCIHLTYHKDGEPGNTFQPSDSPAGTPAPDPYGPYDVIYNCITNPVGLNENAEVVLNAVVYPNPVQSVLNYDFALTQAQDVTVNLVDVLGKTVYSEVVNATSGINNVKINVKTFAAGIYALNTVVGNATFTEKVIIK